MSDSEELKPIEDIPCPVCGARNDQMDNGERVFCKNCSADAPAYWWRWNYANRRPVPPPGVETEGVEAARKVIAVMKSIAGKRLAIKFPDDETALQITTIVENAGKCARALLSTSSRGGELSSRGLTRASLPASDGIPSEWRPIESAPKDGTQIILAGPYSADLSIARWDGRYWQCMADGSSAIRSQSDFGTDYITFEVPSHWMPLPEPPVGSQASE